MTATLLESARLVRIEGGRAHLEYSNAKNRLMLEAALPKVAGWLEEVGAGRLTPVVALVAANAEAEDGTDRDESDRRGSPEAMRARHELLERAKASPEVRRAMEVFDATVVRVEPVGGAQDDAEAGASPPRDGG